MSLQRQHSHTSDPDLEREDVDLTEYEERQHDGAGRNGYANGSSASSMTDTAFGHERDEHCRVAAAALTKLKELSESSDWKRVIKHKHGVDVYIKKGFLTDGNGKHKKVPIYKGEKLMQGHTPEAVFDVAGQRKLWDDWYDTGNLVADLDDTTSLTYMNLRVQPPAARPRDVALVERVEGADEGTIYFVASSVESSKIPHVHGRVRANMALLGLVLKPIQIQGSLSTLCTYFLQVDAEGLLPSAMSSWVVQKRPLCIAKIEEYLVKHRTSSKTQPVQKTGTEQAPALAAVASPRPPGNKVIPTTSEHDELSSTLPTGVSLVESHPSFAEVISAKRKFDQMLSDRDWQRAKDNDGTEILTKTQSDGLLIARGSAVISGGFTTEQVLGTLVSATARKQWDDMFLHSELVENVNGAEHGVWRESQKGIHPHILQQDRKIVRAVIRQEAQSDHGPITLLSRSIATDSEAGRLDVSGWRLQPDEHDNVVLTHISSAALPKPDTPPFITRVIASAEAVAPSKLQSLINEHGFVPFFLRWGAGKAQLDGDVDGVLRQGTFTWRISNDGESSQTGEQVAWLQWSSKMYPGGLTLTSEPEIPLKTATVDGSEDTLQLVLDGIPRSGLLLHARRHDGKPGSVIYNGSPVTDSISAPKGAAAQRKVAKPARPLVATQSNTTGDAPSARDPDQNVRSPMSPSAEKLSAVRDSAKSVATELITVHHPPKLDDGRRALPDDAMLILTKDLYFTRAQMAVISALLVIVYSLARFT